jgi:hypothetical protein
MAKPKEQTAYAKKVAWRISVNVLRFFYFCIVVLFSFSSYVFFSSLTIEAIVKTDWYKPIELVRYENTAGFIEAAHENAKAFHDN